MRARLPKAKSAIAGTPPVLKLPPELAIPAIRVLAAESDPTRRRNELVKLRASIPERTLLNAYVLPSLNELGLFRGSLRDGEASRYGRMIAEAAQTDGDKAKDLFARQLMAIDRERVGFVEWLLRQRGLPSNQTRGEIYHNFAHDVTGKEHIDPAFLDRLGKWVGYLTFYDVARGEQSTSATSGLSIDSRHIRALSAESTPRVSDMRLGDAIREAYAQATRRIGSRLYIPVTLLRDEIGHRLASDGILLTDAEIDAALRRAPVLLPQYTVSFSPFSGPSKGGLRLPNMYAGFVSIRKGAKTASS